MASKFYRRLAGAVAVAATAITAAVVLVPSTASADSVPAAIAPPAGMVEVGKYRVKVGFQIYKCVAGAWTLKAPAAMVLNSERDGRTIYHYGGPTWQSMTDGSLVTAIRKADSPVTGSIPQLLLEVNSHGGTVDGELSKVAYIQRINTSGGLAPAGACVDGAEQPVAYGADYVFFAPAGA
ncbi:MAG TPA: DUF3455 domain-containing protein [Micromonosporaceae bacterium]